MEVLYTHILPHLPLPLQEIILNPPSLTDPTSFIPIFKLLLPYTKWILVLSSIYILWSFLSGVFGMFSRVLRFTMRIGPIIGLVAWLMNSSGQGSMDELFGLVKQYFGLEQGGAGGWSPGIAGLASLFTDQSNTKTRSKSRKSWTGSGVGSDPISSRTRGNKKKSTGGGDASAGEIFENLVNQATNEDNVNAVQDFVKNSLAKAAGLDWLFGGGTPEKEEKAKKWKSR
ncbi:hypothetical protein I302_100587 [Kwoniella bestiolae CBS 10118]|uniref:Uncharacterized protein n=1 Tax=Kwoniella bestiolae CBS 10118 TaxID=1296100 RepID=A0A1B9G5J1_9TREE|nr:hypothetical protein I302_03962 [Kwoniella bestiolae CBS 10118]OCF26280.1 hypothetical protein I302_03962 [Kwoniella bestiolae CBS 10118]